MTMTTPPTPGSHASRGNGNGNGHKPWRRRPITNLRGTIGATIVVLGFLGSVYLTSHESNIRDKADCQSLNDRTLFGVTSREAQIANKQERVDQLDERTSDGFDASAVPGFNDLDAPEQAYVVASMRQRRRDDLAELERERAELQGLKEDLELYRDSIPFEDCPDTEHGIDAGDFTGR